MSGWPMATLESLAAPERGAITDGPFGSNLTSSHYTDAGPQVVRLQNIGNGVYKSAPAHISVEHFERLRKHEAVAGDLLVASLGESLPRACLMPDGVGLAIVKADCIRIRLAPEVDPRWVLYSLQRQEVRSWAKDQLHGVGRPRLGLKTIRQIPVPLPDLPEQRRIVDILEDHLSHLDAANLNLQSARDRGGALLERSRVDLSRSPGAVMARIDSIGAVVTGSTPRTADGDAFGGDLPFLTPGDLGLGDEIHRTARALNEFGQRGVRRLTGGSIVAVVCIGASLGKVGWSSSDLASNQQINAVVADPAAYRPDYLSAIMSASPFQELLRTSASSTTLPILNKSKFSALLLPVVGRAQQDDLMDGHLQLVASVEHLRREVVRSQSRLASLRRALLQAAFSGNLTGAASDADRIEQIAFAQ